MKKLITCSMVVLLTAAFAPAASWSPSSDGAWETGSNWSTGIAPGSAGATDNDGQIRKAVTVTLSTSTVQTFSMGNIDTGATLIIDGGSHNLTQPTISRYNAPGTWEIAGGTVTVDSGGQKVRFYDDPDSPDGGTSVIKVSGGTFILPTYVRFLTGAGTPSATNRTKQLFQITGGEIQNGIFSMNDDALNYHDATLEVVGSTANIGGNVAISSIDAARNAGNTDGVNKLNYVLDGSGVSAINVGTLTLSDADGGSTLTADVSALAGDTSVVLANYTALNGTFSDGVTITDDTYGTLTPGVQGSLNPGEYALDYSTGDAVTLFYNTVPEPATMSLLAIGGIALLRRRRK